MKLVACFALACFAAPLAGLASEGSEIYVDADCSRQSDRGTSWTGHVRAIFNHGNDRLEASAMVYDAASATLKCSGAVVIRSIGWTQRAEAVMLTLDRPAKVYTVNHAAEGPKAP